MSRGTIWNVTVSHLLSDFRDALVALVPIAKRTWIAWRKPQAYDDWEEVEAVLFHSIVASPFENNAEGVRWSPLVSYDFVVETYASNSFVGLADTPYHAAFLCLDTQDRPFDTCVAAVLDHEGWVTGEVCVPFDAAQFAFAARRDGSISLLNEINVL